MSNDLLERRIGHSERGVEQELISDLVREGLSVQHNTGTVSAIEFLKANGVETKVIQRVLSGSPLRSEDSLALLWEPAAFEV